MNECVTWQERLNATCVAGADVTLLLDGGHTVVGTILTRAPDHFAVDLDVDGTVYVHRDTIKGVCLD